VDEPAGAFLRLGADCPPALAAVYLTGLQKYSQAIDFAGTLGMSVKLKKNSVVCKV
jgi:hypothetical protein